MGGEPRVKLGGAVDNNNNVAGRVIISNVGALVPDDMDNSLGRSRTAITGTMDANDTVTWTAGQNIRKIIVTGRLAGPPSAVGDEYAAAALTFNAPDLSTANTWCTASNHASNPNKHYIIHSGQVRTFIFSAPVTNAWFKKAVGNININLYFDAFAGE